MMKQGWEIKKLGDVATILDSQRKPVTKKDRCNGIYPYYGASGVQDYVDKYIFDGRYLLVGEDGAKWGASDKSAYIVDGKCWVNNHAHILKLDNSINDKMVEYYLVYKDLSEYITGAIVPKLTQQALKQIPIPVPERAEQERIVGELDCLSGIIAAKRAQLRELDTLAQSIFYTMFGDPITNDKGWSVKQLKDVSTLINGRAYKQEELLSEGKYKVIRVGNFFTNGDYYYSDLELDDDKYCDIGDLLFAWSASFGAFIWNGGKVIYHYHIWKVLFDERKLNIQYYRYILNVMTNDFMKDVHGIGMFHLTKAGMEQYKLPIPPLSLQNEFAEKIENIERQKELITKSIKETEDLFNSRMSYYFD